MTDFVVAPPTPDEAAMLARQASLELRLPEHGVAVVGCGGVGSWTAMLLALAGVRNLWLFDHDLVSDHNLNRLYVPPACVGESKAKAVAAAIRTLRPKSTLNPMGRWTSELADSIRLASEVDWMVATTDTWDSRRACYEWARRVLHEGHYLEAAAEGENGSLSATPADFATPEEEHPGYASVPVWVGPCVVAAYMAVAHIIHGTVPTSPELTMRMGWEGQVAFFNSLNVHRPPARLSRSYSILDDIVGTITPSGVWVAEIQDNDRWRISGNTNLLRVTYHTAQECLEAIRQHGSRARTYRAAHRPPLGQEALPPVPLVR